MSDLSPLERVKRLLNQRGVRQDYAELTILQNMIDDGISREDMACIKYLERKHLKGNQNNEHSK